MRPRRPTLKKSVATLSSQDTGDTLKGETCVDLTDQVGDVGSAEGTPAEKRVMIIIDGNTSESTSSSSSSTSSSSSSISSSSTSVSSAECKESTNTE